MPPAVQCTISNFIEISPFNEGDISFFSKLSTFSLMQGESLETIDFTEVSEGVLKVPRGLINEVLDYYMSKGTQVILKYPSNTACHPLNLKVNPAVKYTEGPFYYQGNVASRLIGFDTVRLQAPAGAGKTNISCIFAALLGKGPVLFLADKDFLIRQFISTAKKVLGVSEEDIGIIKAKKYTIKPLTVGSLKTLAGKSFDLEKIKHAFHVVFFDECHAAAAETYRDVLMSLAPKHLIGLSATPHHYVAGAKNDLLHALLGEVGVIVKDTDIPGRLVPEFISRPTKKKYFFKADSDSPEWYKRKSRHRLQSEIAGDLDRNNMIVGDCYKLVKKGYKVLITVNRIMHGQMLYKLLLSHNIRVALPYKVKPAKDDEEEDKTSVDNKALMQAVIDIEDGKVDVLIGTLSLLKQAFDCPPISALLYAAPFSGVNTTAVTQSVGRIQRHYFNKDHCAVVDYVDSSYPVDVLGDWALGREDAIQALIDRSSE